MISQAGDNASAGGDRQKSKQYEKLFKLILIGDSTVGKTCILHRLMLPSDPLGDSKTSTIGSDFRLWTADYNGASYKVQCWDTAGQERFNAITAGVFRGMSGALLVFDVHNRRSFDNIPNWLKNMQDDIKGLTTDLPILLVGNKRDLRYDAVMSGDEDAFVSRHEAEQLAGRYDADYYEISAKTRVMPPSGARHHHQSASVSNLESQVGDVFYAILEKMVRHEQKQTLNMPKRNVVSADYVSLHGGGGGVVDERKDEKIHRQNKCCGIYC